MREAGEPVAAMKSFIAATRVHSSEYTYKARSYSNMATMCRMGERHELAYALYGKSAEQFVLAQDTLAVAYALNNMAWEQAVMGHKNEAMLLADSALRIFPDEQVKTKTAETQAAACLYAGQYDSALLHAQYINDTAYADILRAQAYTYIKEYDSALCYAKRVLERTDNPRYLDDVYYILTQCDSTAAADDIRALAATRTDVQRSLERNDPQWIEAMLLAEQALQPSPHPRWGIIAGACAVLSGILLVIRLCYRRKQIHSLDAQCKALRKSTQLREELCWNDYSRFCAVCNERLSGIADKLAQRGLSEREIRICVLVLIGFSYAEIAEILFRAESGIGKDKYLIAKHLGVSVKDLQNTLRAIAGGK